MACLKKGCASRASAVGLFAGSFFRHESIISLNVLEKGFACASMSSEGGFSATVFMRIWAGVYKL